MAVSTATKNIVNERTAAEVTVTALDLAGSEVVPSTLKYRIDDVNSGNEVKELTAIPSPAAQNAITLAPADNAIVNPSLKEEPKRVTVIADQDTANEARAQFTYYVRNMSYVS